MPFAEMEGDVADGMARRLDHRGAALAERHRVALPHRLVQLRQPMRIRRGADDPAAEPRLQLRDAGDMVAMVMGQQDQVEPAAELLHRRDGRAGLARVADRDRAGRLSCSSHR